jgi:hypothetical protein
MKSVVEMVDSGHTKDGSRIDWSRQGIQNFVRRHSPDRNASANCRWRTRRRSRAENKLPDAETTWRRTGGLIENHHWSRQAAAIHGFKGFNPNYGYDRHRYRILIRAVVPGFKDFADLGFRLA